jgi:hypothetical protein
MGNREQRLLRLDLAVEIGTKRHVRIGKTLEHIDHDQRRTLAESDPDPEAALSKEFLVVLAAGHALASSCAPAQFHRQTP